MKDESSIESISLVRQFHDAFNAQNLDAVMALMTENPVFENTFPPPDGTRSEGAEAVRAAFAAFFQSSPGAHFEIEDIFAAGEHAALRWLYRWTDNSGVSGYVRGVDIFRLHDGKIAEKLSYVKG